MLKKLFKKRISEEDAYKSAANYFGLTPEEVEGLKEKRRKKEMKDNAKSFYEISAEYTASTSDEIESGMSDLARRLYEDSKKYQVSPEAAELFSKLPSNEELIDFILREHGGLK